MPSAKSPSDIINYGKPIYLIDVIVEKSRRRYTKRQKGNKCKLVPLRISVIMVRLVLGKLTTYVLMRDYFRVWQLHKVASIKYIYINT